MTDTIEIDRLQKRYGSRIALHELDLHVRPGTVFGLIGPNGAGKTTVFNCVTGFYKPTEGRITLRRGRGIPARAVEELTRSGRQTMKAEGGELFLLERMADFRITHTAGVARTFQNIRLFGGMTVFENLLVAQHNRLMVASGFTFAGLVGLPSYRRAQEEAQDLAVDWLKRTALLDRADDPAADLSYGDQRRLEIARAMCTKPALLCLDEPAAGLNPRESAELNDLLRSIRDDDGVSILLIEHDMGVVMEISDHIVVLDYGKKISDGTPDSVRNDPNVIAAYLGVDDEEVEAVEEKLEQGDVDAAIAEANLNQGTAR